MVAATPIAVYDRQRARELDQADPLAGFRDRFVIEDEELIYLDGNSLGRLPEATHDRLTRVVEREWGDRLIRGWNENWFEAPQRIGGKIAGLIGADPDEVLVADSTSVNLFKLALAALQTQGPKRTHIVTDDLNFPSDIYIAEAALKLAGRAGDLTVVPSSDGIHGPIDAIVATLNDRTALLTLTHTAFKSSYTYDMAQMTARAKQAGVLSLWDLSHSVGAVPVDLHACGADLAVGCCYKYLNGGPGAPAFLYVRRDLQKLLQNPVSGWMGAANLFDFGLHYQPDPGIRRFLTGTPPILSLCAIEPGLDLLCAAGMAQIRDKSLRLSGFLIDLWREHLQPLGFRLNSPTDAACRGPHISLGHDEAQRIDLALIREMQVLPDFRKPDNIRLGIPPLYTRFIDVYDAIMRMREVVESGRYLNQEIGPDTVT